MSKFKETIIELGNVKTNTRKKIFFTFNGNVGTIKRVAASCSCTTPKVKKDGVEVIFNSGAFPKQLLGRDYYETMKQVIVYFENGEKEVLTFKAKIVKK